jgi:hypothetical protein
LAGGELPLARPLAQLRDANKRPTDGDCLAAQDGFVACCVVVGVNKGINGKRLNESWGVLRLEFLDRVNTQCFSRLA